MTADMVQPSPTMEEFFWWHSIPLADGRITPGIKPIEMMDIELANTFDPIDLHGKSLVDIGAWTGGFSIEAKRRGADRVVAIDHVVWTSSHFRGREAFDYATHACGFQFETMDIDVDAPRLDLSRLGQFDIVLFLGVIYHLIDPIAALREIALLAKEVLVLETYIEPTADPRPAMVFYPGAELNNDPSNWWAPNTACVIALLNLVGFARVVDKPGSNPDRRIFHAYRN